ncbi:CesT family type III secretion system chaperone [Endozoicomonas sp. OPT23]|uniref:CesT family type III secretion system chaperone n=1 Tax=Endozoicomonas sp. OPT23 TaxID=2072845 RepID=UPI0021055944|nr:CesT family type III secretion system chaperone [Endozoicomonas sp. OPT23]
MKSVAQRNELGDLDFRDNRYHLTIDGRIELTCFQANGKFYLHGLLAGLPAGASEREKVLRDIMKKTLGLSTTQRVILSVEPDQDALALHYSCNLQGLDEEAIEESLSEFANNFEYYTSLIHQDQLMMPAMPTMIMP